MSRGTVIRDTPFAKWTDPDAVLESMSGPTWARALKAEDAAVQPYITATKPMAIAYSAGYKKIRDTEKHYMYILGNIVHVTVLNRFTVRWSFIGSKEVGGVIARDVTVSPCGGYVLSTENDVAEGHEGNEDYTLTAYSVESRRMVWFIPHVGDTVSIVDGRVYYTLIKNKLWNYGIASCDLETGRLRKTVAVTGNCRENYSIERGADGVVFVGLEDSQEFTYSTIGIDGILRRSMGPHAPPRAWQLPKGQYGIDMVWPSTGLMITKTHGLRALWKCGASVPARKLLEIPAGFIRFDPSVFHKAHVDRPRVIPFVVARPDSHLTYYRIVGGELSHVSRVGLGKSLGNGLECFRHQVVSADGVTVHYIVVKSKRAGNPVRLMVVGYGAYAMETSTGMIRQRWGPLLDAGWAIAVGFLRGGGDHTAAWGLAGRRSGRVKTWEDMEAVVRGAQKVCRLGPAQSCIYGRSAGGYLVGALLGRNPEGDLFRGVYTEVPYVDVLQTTTNPALPLTRIEYGEFGNPSESLADFIFVGLTSPATTATVMSCPNVFVLARTAENDSQVYTYEAIKWVKRLRANQVRGVAPKLCIVERGQGHFTPPDSEVAQYGVDAALLEELMK